MDPSSSSNTIPTLKSTFLRHQIRLLSSPLQPSSTWSSPPSSSTTTTTTTTTNPPSPLPPQLLTTVLQTLNTHLHTHNRAAYPPQTQRHIAEQIDALYRSDLRALSQHPPPATDETIIATGSDLSTPPGLAALPDAYEDLFLFTTPPPPSPSSPSPSPSQQQSDADEEEGKGARRYLALKASLAAAMAEQGRQRARLERYRALRRWLEPFQQDAGGGGEEEEGAVQGNLLVGREEGGGELGRELERLRGLVERVVRGLGELGRSPGEGRKEEGEREGEGAEGGKLRDVMDVL